MNSGLRSMLKQGLWIIAFLAVAAPSRLGAFQTDEPENLSDRFKKKRT